MKTVVNCTFTLTAFLLFSLSNIALAKHTHIVPKTRPIKYINQFQSMNTVEIYNEIQNRCTVKVSEKIISLDGFRTHSGRRMFIYSRPILAENQKNESIRVQIILDGLMGDLNSQESTRFVKGVDIVTLQVKGYNQGLIPNLKDSSSIRSHFIFKIPLKASVKMNNGERWPITMKCQ